MSRVASYILTAYASITSLPPDKLLDVGYQTKDPTPIPSFDENLLIDLCNEAQKIFESENNILEIEGNFIIVGDIHGSFHDLLRILQFIYESDAKVIFLGDYVDRGNFSLECITILFSMKVMRPNDFYLIRGNHEFEAVCSLYGFKDEIIHYHDPKKDAKKGDINLYNGYDLNCYRYTENLYEAFLRTFSYLPIGAILNLSTFCIHGGLSPKIDHVEYLQTLIQRPVKNFEESLLLTDLVWSDPSHSSKLFEENLRGKGYLFNRESIKNFLDNSSLVRMIRGHQCVKNGCVKNFGDKCITIFSASSYDKEMGNKSAILQLFERDDSIHVKTFPPIKRLQKSDAVYYKVQPLNSIQNNIKNVFSLQFSSMSLRIPSSPSFSQIKSQRSENFLFRQNSALKIAPIVKPKFTTNSKKCLIQIPRIQSSNSFNTFNLVRIEEDDIGPEQQVVSKSDVE